MTMEKRMIGVGGVRPAHSRWIITGKLVLDSAAHFGGQSDMEGVDMVLIRDKLSDAPKLPGTSLAGALRSHLSDSLNGYLTQEHENVSKLFGGSRSDDAGRQSPCYIFDSISILPASTSVEIRDAVRIDSASGTADDHGKFDMELLPAGTHFPLRIEVLIPSEDDEADIISYLLTILMGLEQGEITLGARTTRGLGRCHVSDWRTIRYDLQSSQGWLKWLNSDHINPTRDMKSYSEIKEAFSAACSFDIPSTPDERNRIVIDFDLKIKGGLLIRSPGVDPEEADLAHIISGGYSIVPSSSMAGVLRQRAYRILQLLSGNPVIARKWVEGMFGPDLCEKDAIAFESRVRVSENRINGGARLRPNRIRVDRFTGGAMKGALFDEEPHYKGNFTVRIELRNPCKGELGLLLLLAKDLITGDLPIGGSASVGRGYVEGTATISGSDKDLLGCKGVLSEKNSSVDKAAVEAVVQELVTILKEGI